MKHIDLSDKNENNVDYFLYAIDGMLGHLWERKGVLPKSKQAHFTYEEINKLHTGSYEQIEVTE